jgi:hypothetical protein
MAPTRPRRLLRALIPALLPLAVACGSDDSVEPDPELSELVGDWDATTMVFTSVDQPSVSVDIIDIGATFFLNVQPSGSYTSSLAYQGLTATELGRLEIRGDRLLFFVEVAPTGPRVDTATFELVGDRLDLDGRTIFDFDLNGIGEDAELDATLRR